MINFDRLEKRWGWLAFPGFLRFYALFHVLVFVLQWMRPDLAVLLEFDRQKILGGEVWRMATMFFAVSQFGGPSIWSVVFLIFVVNFIFMVADGLEGAWGAFKASIFYYMGILLILAGNAFYPVAIPLAGGYLYLSAFLAFATLFPKTEILLFLIIPVQVRFLGMIAGAGVIVQVIGAPVLLPFVVVALLNYALFAGIPTLRGTAQVLGSAQRKRRFNSKKMPAAEAFHTCVICDRTDRSDPYLDFRIGADGSEYCAEHLPEIPPRSAS